jgi:tetratricopeptide (TPR) repeat protein
LKAELVEGVLPQPRRSQSWLISPLADLCLFVAAPLAIVPGVAWMGRYLAPEQIFLIVAAFASLGHHLPGFLRAYGDRDLFQRFRCRFIIAPPAVLLVAVLCSLLGLHGLELILLPWATWHIMMQTYGFMRIYDLKRGGHHATAARLDFLLCSAVFVVGIVFSEARVFGMAETMLRIGVPLPSASWLVTLRWIIGIAAVGIACAYVVDSLRRGWTRHNPVKLLLLGSTAWLFWICGSISTNLLIGVAMFEVFHALQYCALVWIYNRRRVPAASESPARLSALWQHPSFRLAMYIAAIAAFGALRFTTEGFHQPYTKEILVGILAASTLLHFYYDGFIWKVSERKTQQPLGIDGVEEPARAASGATGWSHALKWATLIAIGGGLLALELQGANRAEDSENRIITQLATFAPQLPELQVRISQHALAQGDYETAMRAAEQALALRPRSHEAHAALGVALLHAKQFPAAAERLRQATQLAPKSWENFYDLAQAESHIDNWDAATAAFARAAELQPGRSEIYLAWGKSDLRQGDTDLALAHLREALALAPSSQAEEIEIAIVDVLSEQGEHAQSLEMAEALVQKKPRSFAARMCLGELFGEQRRWPEAVANLQVAAELEPEAAEAQFQLGVAYVQLAEFAKAQQALRKAIALRPDHGLTHFQLGNVHYFQNDLEQARQAYQRCVELLPNLADAHSNLGSVLFEQDRLSEAADEYYVVLELQPENARGNYNLGLVLIQQNKLEQARHHIQKAAAAGIAPSPEVARLLNL